MNTRGIEKSVGNLIGICVVTRLRKVVWFLWLPLYKYVGSAVCSWRFPKRRGDNLDLELEGVSCLKMAE